MNFEPLNDSQPPVPNENSRARPDDPGRAEGLTRTSRLPRSQSAESHGPRFSARRWLLIAVGLTLIGVIGAFASVVLRRTQTDQTARFWGPEVIRALQISEEFRLKIPPDGPLQWKTESADGSVDLSDTPGIAHLRHALLDQRHYRWEKVRGEAIESVIAQIPDAEWVSIELAGVPSETPDGPPAEPVELKLELSRGWVGIAGGGKSVQMTERVRSAVRHNLLMFSNVASTRADVK